MPRELDDKDIALLKKLAPELKEILCEHSQMPYKSILPPLANHFSKEVKDFERYVFTSNVHLIFITFTALYKPLLTEKLLYYDCNTLSRVGWRKTRSSSYFKTRLSNLSVRMRCLRNA